MIKKKLTECNSCSYETTCKFYDNQNLKTKHIKGYYFCELCACTMTGVAMEFPRQYREGGDAMRTICYIGNLILDKLKEK